MPLKHTEKLIEVLDSKLNNFIDEFCEIKIQFQDSKIMKDREILQLKDVVDKLEEGLSKNEDKMKDTNVNSWANNTLLSGDDVPNLVVNENRIEFVRIQMKGKQNLVLPTTDIVPSKGIGKNSGWKKNILVKFNSFVSELDVLIACKSKKLNFHANDDQTPNKQTILHVLS